MKKVSTFELNGDEVAAIVAQHVADKHMSPGVRYNCQVSFKSSDGSMVATVTLKTEAE